VHIIIHILQVGKLNWRDGVAGRCTEIGDGIGSIIWRFDLKPIESGWIVS